MSQLEKSWKGMRIHKGNIKELRRRHAHEAALAIKRNARLREEIAKSADSEQPKAQILTFSTKPTITGDETTSDNGPMGKETYSYITGMSGDNGFEHLKGMSYEEYVTNWREQHNLANAVQPAEYDWTELFEE